MEHGANYITWGKLMEHGANYGTPGKLWNRGKLMLWTMAQTNGTRGKLNRRLNTGQIILNFLQVGFNGDSNL